MMKPLRHPEVMIMYVPNDGLIHMLGAHKNPDGWNYSKWSYMPDSELNGWLKEWLERNHLVIDLRVKANLIHQGMGNATPILVIKPGFDTKEAVEMAMQLHRKILAD